MPILHSPFIEDDYPLIAQAIVYGSHTGWGAGFADAVNRPRLASLYLLDILYRFAGMDAAAYYLASIAIHILNCLLVFALGAWKPIGYRVAACAAAFFAVYEGHNEAVMWISANNELLLFLFAVSSIVCWIHFLDASPYRWIWYGISLAAYCLALLSKESAVIVIILLPIPLLFPRRSLRSLPPLVPFAIITVVSISAILQTRTYSGHFHDGSFSLASPFLWTWINSFLRLFWIWGLLALITCIAVYRRVPESARIGLVWAAAALVPYIFLTYNTRVPSRHTYLASAGVALIVGAAAIALYNRWPNHALIATVVLAVVLQNTGWLWTRKRTQFLQRAEPTQELIALARQSPGSIYVRCFPRAPVIAEQAVALMTGHPATALVWTEEEARAHHATTSFCYSSR